MISEDAGISLPVRLVVRCKMGKRYPTEEETQHRTGKVRDEKGPTLQSGVDEWYSRSSAPSTGRNDHTLLYMGVNACKAPTDTYDNYIPRNSFTSAAASAGTSSLVSALS